MKHLHRAIAALILIAVLISPLPGTYSRAAAVSDQLQTPEQFFGFRKIGRAHV